MKKIVILAAIAALTLTVSCTKNTVVATPQEDAISISAFTPAATKGQTSSSTALETFYHQFNVYAFVGTTTFMGNIPYVYTTSWAYQNDTDKKYWPQTDVINFYGYVPVSAYATPSITSAAQTLSVVVPTASASQQDVMYAKCLNATKSNRDGDNTTATPASGSVPMVFHHALSQVNFAAKNTNSLIDVTVSGVAIQNVKNTVSVDFSGNATTTGTATNYAATLDNASYALTATAVTMTTNDHLILAPQSVATTAWDKTAADITGSRFAITCKIVDHATNVVIYDGVAYLPASFNWQSGKNYTYTFIFGDGAGKTPDGEDILDYITFIPSVQPWVDQSENVTM